MILRVQSAALGNELSQPARPTEVRLIFAGFPSWRVCACRTSSAVSWPFLSLSLVLLETLCRPCLICRAQPHLRLGIRHWAPRPCWGLFSGPFCHSRFSLSSLETRALKESNPHQRFWRPRSTVKLRAHSAGKSPVGRGKAPPVPIRSLLLLGFFVFCVLVATSTIFTDVEAVWIVLFVFHCSVIAFFAVITRQSDDHAIVFLSHGLYSRKCPEKKRPLPRCLWKYI